LPEGYKVWIDNVHIDTFVEATNPYFNGILQDTMDDRVHTSLIMGFPIDNDTYYSSSNLISLSKLYKISVDEILAGERKNKN